ncbi:MAG: hypothetical protein KOO69_04005 [Victivallales bacterium]|nr:hypothetical protein [Victivallales bacterium]
MKNKIFISLLSLSFFSLIMLTVSAENNNEIVLKDGRILKNPYIISKTPVGLNIGHENGVIFVPFSKMSQTRQEQYNYSPKESKKYKKKIVEAQHKRQTRLAKQQARAKKSDSGSVSYGPERFPARSTKSRLQTELYELIREKSRLEKEYSRVSSGRISPKSGPSDDTYISYRGGKVYRKKRTNYAKQQTKNINIRKRRLKEINSALQRNIRRTNTVRNLISRSQIGGIKKGRTMR